jgi:hypothetical protein
MREDEIVKAANFLRSDAVKSVPADQQKKFLQDKLTEEEISEVMRRVKQSETSPRIVESQGAERRLR